MNKKKKPSPNKEYLIVTYAVMFLLLVMSAYFCYFLYFKSESFINNSYNQRLSGIGENIIRGDIISKDGVVLATTVLKDDGSYERVYPEGRKYAHAVGYDTRGMMGLEKNKNFYLLRSHSFILDRLVNEVLGNKNQGDTLVSTLDSKLQNKAYDLMGNYKGAIIAMEPDTGKILAMISKSDFDPNTIDTDWDTISADSEASRLLNRATAGLYPPGSTFKILTALEYLNEGGSLEDRFTCSGSFTYNDHSIHCYHNNVHGDISFKEAFEKSCNSVFSQISLDLDKENLKKLSNRLMFNKYINSESVEITNSLMDINADTKDEKMMQTAIGQGDTLVTPMHLLLITSALANNGIMMEPIMSDSMVNSGNTIRTFKSKSLGKVFEDEEVSTLKTLMRGVVENGTGRVVNSDLYTAYGKTGSAEFKANSTDSHSIFVGFAENENKKIAVVVLMEGAGSGSDYAAPAASELFNVYFSN